MPGLVPGIHVFLSEASFIKAWMAGTSPAMTSSEFSYDRKAVDADALT